MSNFTDHIFNSFSHIAREVQIYFLSGFLLYVEIAYLLFKDNFFYFTPPKSLIEITLLGLVCYILGHLIFALYCSIELLLSLFYSKKEILTKEIDLYCKDKGGYTEFIERYNVLFLMRINLATTFLILVCICCIFSIDIHISLLNLFAGIIMLILAILTKMDHNLIINKFVDTIKNK